MKFLKRKDYADTTIRKVMDNEKTRVLCVVGTVEDLLKAGILEWCDYDGSLWLSISNCQRIRGRMGRSREEALRPFTMAGY